eukprot:gnl/Spiro4/23660_TR11700_c0_g2_i1.p1 gnl/Spiro4/23660_TR11700_c0_g2~~gnl/Spiro4/23660_TR11700_c0_g2_i1.p1  ORF type:complete len:980 (+),score=388.85 gnl/Spiro4/23660_TR11700_c0_g2_i1:61-3000(+)
MLALRLRQRLVAAAARGAGGTVTAGAGAAVRNGGSRVARAAAAVAVARRGAVGTRAIATLSHALRVRATAPAAATAPSASAGASTSAGGGDDDEQPFYESGMSASERERVTKAIGQFQAAEQFAQRGTPGAREEAGKLFLQVVETDPTGALGFRALLALAALHTAAGAAAQRFGPSAGGGGDNVNHSARVIDYTARALQLLQRASVPAKRRILQLSGSDGSGSASDATVEAGVAEFVWGLRLNVGFQTIDWLINRRVTNPNELQFLLVLLREHMNPRLIFEAPSDAAADANAGADGSVRAMAGRSDDDARQMIERARKSLLAVSEYLKSLRLFADAESFAVAALHNLGAAGAGGGKAPDARGSAGSGTRQQTQDEWVAEGYFQVAAIRTQSGAKPDAVLPWAHKALNANPAHWKSHALCGELAVFAGDHEKAISHLGQALANSAMPVEFKGSTHYSMANALFQKAAALERAVAAQGAANPAAAQATAAAARAEYEGVLDECLQHYESALLNPAVRSRMPPQLVAGVQANYGAALLKRGRTQDAMQVLRDSSSASAAGGSAAAAGAAGALSLARLNLVLALLSVGPFASAAAEWKPFIGVTRLPTGEVEDVDAKLVEAAVTEGAKRLVTNPNDALDYFRGAQQVLDASPRADALVRPRWGPGIAARIGLAEQRRMATAKAPADRQTHYEAAVASLKQALELLERYAAQNAAAGGNGAGAVSAATPAAGSTVIAAGGSTGRDVFCTRVSVLLALAQTHHMLGNPKGAAAAQESYESALNCTDPAPTLDDRVLTLYNLASLQLMAGAAGHGRADAYLRQADMLKADNKMVLNLLAQTQLLQGKADDALALLKRVQELDPNFVEQYPNWCDVHLRTGDFRAALASAQRSLQIDPNYQPHRCHFSAGLAWVGLGRMEEARAHLELAMQLEPALTLTIKPILASLPESSADAAPITPPDAPAGAVVDATATPTSDQPQPAAADKK